MPNDGFQLVHGVIFKIAAAQIKQLVLHSHPHTLATSIVVTAPAGTVHALNNSIARDGAAVFFACVLTYAIRMNYCTLDFRVTFILILNYLVNKISQGL